MPPPERLDDLLGVVPRVAARVAAIAARERAPLNVTAVTLPGEPEPLRAVLLRPESSFSVGEAWGGPWQTVWFHLTGLVPAGWAGRPVALHVDLGPGLPIPEVPGGLPGFSAEGLLYRDGLAWAGVAPQHTDHVLLNMASGGEPIDLWLEAAANPYALEAAPPAELADGPLIARLNAAHLTSPDPTLQGLARRLLLAGESARRNAGDPVLGPRSLAELAILLRHATGVTDDGREPGPRPRERHPAVKLGSPAVAVGNAHIDTAWLWPYRETRRKVARTMASTLRLLAAYPEHRFALSQPQQLSWLAEDHPELWAGVRAAISDGRIEAVGAMWVEPDCNLPGGESLVRQIVEGQRFWAEHCGVEPRNIWLPDVFGYPAALPTIMRAAGLTGFVTQKLSWNETTTFPLTTFWWEGIDGSSVVAHLPPADTYEGTMVVDELSGGAAKAATTGDPDSWLYLYGFGDGGGGPTPDMMERLHLLAGISGIPSVRVGCVSEFLEEAAVTTPRTSRWVGELRLEKHRGTFTAHRRQKQRNRRLEELFATVELWAVAAGAAPDLSEAWRRLLLHQFHDVLPGTSITRVHREVAADYDSLEAELTGLRAALERRVLGGGDTLMALNDSPYRRVEWITVEGQRHRVDVPALGWAPVEGQKPATSAPVTTHARTVSNGLVSLTWSPAGELTSFIDLSAGRDIASGALAEPQLFRDRPPRWDAWDIDARTLEQPPDHAPVTGWRIDPDPVETLVTVLRRVGLASTLSQTFAIRAGSARVDIVHDLGWHEEHTLLKIAFPLTVRSSEFSCDVQLGHVGRPTHRNTPDAAATFEVCAHRWVDLSEAGFGVSILNDGSYGHDALGSTLRVSLATSSGYPDPTADRGDHRVTLSILPHRGPLESSDTREQAAALNQPLRVTRGATGPARSIVSVDRPGFSVDAVLPSRSGHGWIMRGHETLGGSHPVELTTTLPWSRATPVDLLERPLGPQRDHLRLTLTPFELVTLRLTDHPSTEGETP